MIVLALDTATPSTVAGLSLADGTVLEARDDPGPGERPAHAARLLSLAEDVLDRGGLGWTAIERLAVGVGPGSFTGLRIGIATARGLAQAHAIPVVAVSSLRALASAAAPDAGEVVAVLDARRGEVFAGSWRDGTPVLPVAAYPPAALAAALRDLRAPRCVGDGAVRFRAELEAAGAIVAPDGSPAHRIGAAALCRLGAAGTPEARDGLLPDYRREPDATPPRQPS